MARILGSKCPMCGAALDVAPNVEVVTCHYCGHRSVVEWPGNRQQPASPQVEAWRIDPSFGRIAMPAQRQAGAAIGVVIVLTIVLGIGGAVTSILSSRSSSSSYIAPPPMPIPVNGDHGAPAPGDPLGGVQPPAQRVSVPDPTKADIADVVRQARAVAVALEPHADRLSSVVAFGVVGGTLDTTQGNAASIDFSFRYTDPSKPPGQHDVVEGSVSVHVHNGILEPRKMDAFFRDKVLTAPTTCTSKSVWAAAVKSGLPDNAVATFHVYDNSPFSPKSPTVWSIRVDGHDEYRREFDVTNCALVKSWASDKPAKH